MFGTMTIVWDKNKFHGTATIAWDNNNCLGEFIMIFKDLCCSDMAAAVSTANYCSAAKSPF